MFALFRDNEDYLRARAIFGYEEKDTRKDESSDDELQEEVLTPYDFAGVKNRKIYKIRTVGVTLASTVAAIAMQNVSFLAFIPLIHILHKFMLSYLATKRASEFERDWPPLLHATASSVRAGSDQLQALLSCKSHFESDSVIVAELVKLGRSIELGLSEEVAIEQFANTINYADIEHFRVAFLISRKEGAPLSPCLNRLVKYVRFKQSFRRKVKAAVAMQKLSIVGIILCIFAMLGIQFATSTDKLLEALSNSYALTSYGMGLALVVMGAIFMFKIATPRI